LKCPNLDLQPLPNEILGTASQNPLDHEGSAVNQMVGRVVPGAPPLPSPATSEKPGWQTRE